MSAAKAKIITPEQFWDLYFQNRFQLLRRTDVAIEGSVVDGDPSAPASMFAPEYSTVRIDKASLSRYSYDIDPRFSRIENHRLSLDAALRESIDGTYPYREPSPFGTRRMSELGQQMLDQFDWSGVDRVHPKDFVSAAYALIERPESKSVQMLNAMLWHLGERRDPWCANVMYAAIECSEHVEGRKETIHYSVVDTAFEALWKMNDKTMLERLLSIMERSDHAGRLAAAALFKRLLSSETLLSLTLLSEDYYSVLYWETLVQPLINNDGAKWIDRDSRSLFWEIRYFSAHRVEQGSKILPILANDEVSTVSTLARSRME